MRADNIIPPRPTVSNVADVIAGGCRLIICNIQLITNVIPTITTQAGLSTITRVIFNVLIDKLNF